MFGNDFGPGCAAVGTGREPDSTDEITQFGHLFAGGGVGAVEGVSRRQRSDQSARLSHGQGLDQEVVVDGVPAGVTGGVMKNNISEGDVADRCVHSDPSRLGERFGPDVCAGVELRGDSGRNRVQLDADHVSVLRRVPDEVAGSASWLQHRRLVGQAEAVRGVPQQLGYPVVGVVGIDRGTCGRAPFCLRQKLPEPGAFRRELGIGWIEHLGYRTP